MTDRGPAKCRLIGLCLLALASLITPAGFASAQPVTPTDAKCRATIDKLAGKYAGTANKAVVACIKARTKGAGSPASCSNPLGADAKGKLDKARIKLIDKVGDPSGKCGVASTDALNAFATGGCPSPGSVGALGTFADVAACVVELAANAVDGAGRIEGMWSHVLEPDFGALSSSEAAVKCVNDLAKQISKLHAIVSKSRGKCQAAADKADGGYSYGCSAADDKQKIAAAEQKLRDTFTARCAPLSATELTTLGSCEVDASAVDCIVDSVLRNAGGLTATHFEYAGVCPTELAIAIRGTGEKASRSRFSAGWTGLLNDSPIPGGVTLGLELDCPDGTCADCALAAACRDGACRCADDVRMVCDEPFGADDDCGGGDCVLYVEPPRPINVSGAPACLVSQASADLAGTASPAAGEYALRMHLDIGVFINGEQIEPCPVCNAGPAPNLGDLGVCAGAAAADPGGACTVDSISPPYGATSRDCLPAPGGLLALMPVARTFTPYPKSLDYNVNCTGGAFGCPCGVCNQDPTAVCATDQDCVDAGVAGPCAGYTAGTITLPNLCSDLVCTEQGECNAGVNVACDGLLDEAGHGILACTDNGDCDSFATICDGGDCGTCTHVDRRRCLPEPMVVDGKPTPDGPLLTALYCVGPTLTAIDPANGFPGLAASIYDTDVTLRCPDSVTPWELGGSNCP
jgi:hypothetical protein